MEAIDYWHINQIVMIMHFKFFYPESYAVYEVT